MREEQSSSPLEVGHGAVAHANPCQPENVRLTTCAMQHFVCNVTELFQLMLNSSNECVICIPAWIKELLLTLATIPKHPAS